MNSKKTGAFFILVISTNEWFTRATYATALNKYKKLGGYGKAVIVPKADAIAYKAMLLKRASPMRVKTGS